MTLQPASGLGSRKRNRNGPGRTALVESVRQQQRRVRSLLEIIDGPIEVHAAIERAQFRRPIGATETDARRARDLRVEIRKFHARGPSPDDNLDEPRYTRGEPTQHVEAS